MGLFTQNYYHFVGFIALFAAVFAVVADDVKQANSSVASTTHSSQDVKNELSETTTVSPELACQYFNNSCEECVKHARCYYCYSTSQCLFYPFSSGFPNSRDCDMGDVRWAICWFNFKALIISLTVMAGVLLVSLSICIFCCCRKKKKRGIAKYAQEEAKREREREERRIRNETRKLERKLKNDEIRRKYGLMKEENPYQRFDA